MEREQEEESMINKNNNGLLRYDLATTFNSDGRVLPFGYQVDLNVTRLRGSIYCRECPCALCVVQQSPSSEKRHMLYNFFENIKVFKGVAG